MWPFTSFRWGNKPRILLLVDRPGWVFDFIASAIRSLLKERFRIDIAYVRKAPKIDPREYDLLYVFFWGETYHLQFGFDPHCIIKEISSYRWLDDPRYGPCTPEEFRQKALRETQAVTCTSLGMVEAIGKTHPVVFHAPNGFDPKRFYDKGMRSGPMTVGWAGNMADPVKRYHSLLVPACEGHYTLLTAGGDLAWRKMNDFYNRVDVFALTSLHEGQSLPVIEAMAAGCFPVCTNVGVVPELVRSGDNGIIVDEPTIEGFRKAFEWCAKNIERVRVAGRANAQRMHSERRWDRLAGHFETIFTKVLAMACQPRFRNDDVSCDCPLDRFSEFCQVFWRHGYTQIHGVTPFGRTIAIDWGGSAPSEYEGEPEILELTNAKIQELSIPHRIQDRSDLIQFLNQSPDEIALHGLYHVDYSVMSADEQRKHILEGLELLKTLFPLKTVRYFIPPYNRVNESLFAVCREFSLTVSAAEDSLEAKLNNLLIKPGCWYRYHHHRFYSDSTFTYYKLSVEALDAAFTKLGHSTSAC